MRAQSLAQGLARDLLARIERLEQLQLVADERCELDRIVTEAESLIHKRLGGEFPCTCYDDSILERHYCSSMLYWLSLLYPLLRYLLVTF